MGVSLMGLRQIHIYIYIHIILVFICIYIYMFMRSTSTSSREVLMGVLRVTCLEALVESLGLQLSDDQLEAWMEETTAYGTYLNGTLWSTFTYKYGKIHPILQLGKLKLFLLKCFIIAMLVYQSVLLIY